VLFFKTEPQHKFSGVKHHNWYSSEIAVSILFVLPVASASM